LDLITGAGMAVAWMVGVDMAVGEGAVGQVVVVAVVAEVVPVGTVDYYTLAGTAAFVLYSSSLLKQRLLL